MTIVISPAKVIVGYLIISIAILALANPGYGAASGFAILLGGTAGSLKLFVELVPDIYYEDLSSGRHLSKGNLIVAISAIALWLSGGVLLFQTITAKQKGGYALATILICIVASVFNISIFALRGI